MMIRGYKIFNPDWTCRGKKYTCPGRFKEDVKPDPCHKGMHFCERLQDCFDYYSDADHTYHYAEVIAHGDVAKDGNKSCTNDMEVVRELSYQKVLELCNTGNCNTGNRNTGDRNTGNCNTGNWNTGDRNTGNCNTGNRNTGNRNTGNCNTGNWNTGDCNTGNWNTGDRNTGNWNTGNWNTGDWNTGDWNTTTGSAGCFCTKEQSINLFNKPSKWTLRNWWESDARALLKSIPKNVVEWVYSSNMTDEGKKEHPTHETTGGYLKVLDEKDNAQRWWDGLPEEKRDIIRAIPNFDADIFQECTGIDVGAGYEQ